MSLGSSIFLVSWGSARFIEEFCGIRVISFGCLDVTRSVLWGGCQGRRVSQSLAGRSRVVR